MEIPADIRNNKSLHNWSVYVKETPQQHYVGYLVTETQYDIHNLKEERFHSLMALAHGPLVSCSEAGVSRWSGDAQLMVAWKKAGFSTRKERFGDQTLAPGPLPGTWS